MFRLIDQLLRTRQNQTALELFTQHVMHLSARPGKTGCPFVCLRRGVLFAFLFTIGLFSIGCGHKKPTARKVPPSPTLPSQAAHSKPKKDTVTEAKDFPYASDLGPIASVPGIHVDPKAKVIWSEVGYASWYGPNYHNKKAANGELYNQNEMTAAHNTLPMNSIVRVVNLQNNQATVVRITDRGPFIGDRIIDLSFAAAKDVNVYLPGTARVRLDVLEAPHPIETGGRWCVQIGAFKEQSNAIRLKQHLLDRYADAQVMHFKGPTGYWVRIRVTKDDKEKTRKVFEQTRVNEGGVFMVRLD